MLSNLTWTPAAGGGTQTIQYKIRSSSAWISYTTVDPTIGTIGVNGLNYNTLYDFQVVNNCPTGATTVVTGSDIKFQCPSVQISPADTSTIVQFVELGGTTDSYKIDLLDATSGTILQTQTLSAPFTTTITATFTTLAALTSYNIHVTPSSFGIEKSNCTTVPFRTINTPVCPAPIGLNATFSNGSGVANATFTWTPQPGIVAQEVWYGKTSTVGSTLPPASGWNQGANLYGATANSANLNNLDINTNYNFAVRSYCTTGQSSWATFTDSSLICPTVTPTVHSTSIDVSLALINPSEFANLVSNLTINLVLVSSGATLSSRSISGTDIVSPYNMTFNGLTASTAYSIVVTFRPAVSSSDIICSTTAVTTSPTATCSTLGFSISNITTSTFSITPTGLSSGDTYDISINNGVSYTYINATQPTQVVTGLSTKTTYSVVVRHNCTNGTNSVTSAQSVTTQDVNFTVIDVFYTCANPACTGKAIYVSTVDIRRTSDNALIYHYDTASAVNGGFSTFITGLVAGTTYSLTANWVVDLSKTHGLSNATLQGNSTHQSYSPSTPTFTESINFVGAATNDVLVTSASLGPICIC